MSTHSSLIRLPGESGAKRRVPNRQIEGRRAQIPSPYRPGQYMSRRELADAVNQALRELYPERKNIAHLYVDGRFIGDLERGVTRWPREERRAALRRVFGVDSDAEIGLYIDRPTGSLDGGDGAGDRPASAESGMSSQATAVPTSRSWVGRSMTVSDGSLLFDTSRPHPARRYNYWLGGKDNFAADRESGDLIAAEFPTVVIAARENRAFQRRAVGYLAAEAGVRQFLDIGTGLPVPDNTHEIAQRVDPTSRVLYVDNDPLVMSHARALMGGDPRGRTGYLEADVRDPGAILRDPTLTGVLDLNEPVGLLLVAVLHFLHDDGEAASVVSRLVGALPSGSFVAISHFTMDQQSPEAVARYEAMYEAGQIDARARSRETLAGFVSGLDLIDPGLVSVVDWRPDQPAEQRAEPEQVAIYGMVLRKP